MKDWEVAQELGRLIVRIRSKQTKFEQKLDALISLEVLLESCAEEPKYEALTKGYRDKKRKGILTYDVKAVEQFAGQMLLTYPSPALREEKPVTLRALVEIDGKRNLYEGIGVCVQTEDIAAIEPLVAAGITTEDGMTGYIGHIEQRERAESLSA